jgi:hypothetical protein
VNFVRNAVEVNNSVFKEQDLRHDYAHDAFVMLVEGKHVLPKEIAMQIKSGTSYCKPTTCNIPAKAGQLTFWAGHDMDTLGIVYDPDEDMAYWVDLKVEARQRTRGQREQTGAVIEFPKSPWNRFDARMFREFLVPTLQGKTPLIGMWNMLFQKGNRVRSTPSLHFNISFSCETSSTVTSRLSPPLCLRSFCTRPTPGRFCYDAQSSPYRYDVLC